MHIYIVSPDINVITELTEKFNCKPDILLSYAYMGKHFAYYLNTYREKVGEIMLDSGAYSEMQGLIEIDLDSYVSYLEPCAHLFSSCINLDTDPDNYDIRMWNLARLKASGLNALPVVHDPYAGEIDDLYDQGYRYILIGSTWGKDKKQLDFIFNRYVYSGNYPGILFHKLGTVTYSTLYDYPFYSSDSAIYAHEAGFGNVLFWNENREPEPNGDMTDSIYFGGREASMETRGTHYCEYRFISEFEDYLWKNFDRRPTDLLGERAAVQRQVINAKYALDLQDRMTIRHEI